MVGALPIPEACSKSAADANPRAEPDDMKPEVLIPAAAATIAAIHDAWSFTAAVVVWLVVYLSERRGTRRRKRQRKSP